MHYYNRDLSPIYEKTNQHAMINSIGNSPYMANSQEYQGNIVNKAFKDNIINSLGCKVICTVQGSAASSNKKPSAASRALAAGMDDICSPLLKP